MNPELVQRIWRGAFQFTNSSKDTQQVVAFSPSGLTVPAANWGPVIQVQKGDVIEKPISTWDIVFVGFDMVADVRLSSFAQSLEDSAYLVQIGRNVTLTLYSHFNGEYHFLVGVYADFDEKPSRTLSDTGRIKWTGKLYVSQPTVEFILPCVFTSFISSEYWSQFPHADSDCLSLSLETASITKLSSIPREAKQRPALRIEPTDSQGIQTSYPRFERLSAKIRELGLAWLIHDKVGAGAWVVYGMHQRGMKDGLVCVYCPDFDLLKPDKSEEDVLQNIKPSRRKLSRATTTNRKRNPKRTRNAATTDDENTTNDALHKRKRRTKHPDLPRNGFATLPSDPFWCASAC